MPNANPTNRKPRFSLRTLLLATTFIVMALVIVMLARELFPLRAEIRQLRSELGELTVDDPERIYAIEIPTASTREWAWRVYLPQGEYCFLAANSMVKQGVPKPDMTFHVGSLVTSGESVVRAAIKDGELFVNVEGESFRMLDSLDSLQAELDSLMGNVDHSIDIVAGEFGIQEELEPNSELILLKSNSMNGLGRDSGAGFTLWIGHDNSGLKLIIDP